MLHICALAYMSDLTLLGSAQVNHLHEREHLQVASLDHAMWFMRSFRADEWLLYDSPRVAGGGRASPTGRSLPSAVSWWRPSCRRADSLSSR
ncbi:acyl-CoA thioesterase family protein [Mycobacterium kansasii]|uniref:Acyl-CoA thioesterase family protein n=1 Tax=Mycobacterium kansasii TaxID=1768 RepID=A0A1V3W964_MYCKA|nr:acyl-CoA thioesterase family protein [Mycobacterium kansasii]